MWDGFIFADKRKVFEFFIAAFQETRLGSLEKGKWADFIVVDANPLQIEPSQIKDINVEQTWVAGEVVYSKTGHDD